ncbi:hypothetical protein BDV96DRAFT_602079 [Lophiotrema nucula]|uniref:Uncharacterized protein n=1 Tax=Lophiotrema nucula TaxID=690887 RepID=A0A6A5YZV9_9PLEO|nr:hypothetical protein BDV96DRAFT_602079 [Lophiotrema nucula]
MSKLSKRTNSLPTNHQKLPLFPDGTANYSTDQVLKLLLEVRRSPGSIIDVLEHVAPILLRDYSKLGITNINKFLEKVESMSDATVETHPYFKWYKDSYNTAKSHCDQIKNHFEVVDPKKYKTTDQWNVWLDTERLSGGKKHLRAAIHEQIAEVRTCMEKVEGELVKLEDFHARTERLKGIENETKGKTEEDPQAAVAAERVEKFFENDVFSLESLYEKIRTFEKIKSDFFDELKQKSQSGRDGPQVRDYMR